MAVASGGRLFTRLVFHRQRREIGRPSMFIRCRIPRVSRNIGSTRTTCWSLSLLVSHMLVGTVLAWWWILLKATQSMPSKARPFDSERKVTYDPRDPRAKDQWPCFQRHLADQCLTDRGKPQVIGAMGGHVDDFHQIGDQSNDEWLDIRGKIDKLFQCGMSRDGSHRRASTDVTTFYDKAGLTTISVDQQYYIETVQDIDIEPSRLMQLDLDLTTRDIGACRAAIGALQWLAQPQICARWNILISELMSGKKMSAAKEIHAIICEIRRSSARLRFQHFEHAKDWRDVTFVTMGDSAHSSRPDGESTGGLLTLAAGPGVIKGGVVPMSIIGWKSSGLGGGGGRQLSCTATVGRAAWGRDASHRTHRPRR